MTLYQLVNDKNNLTTIIKLIRNKVIVDSTIIQHIAIYDRFYSLSGTKGERYNILSKENNMHPNSIQRIITRLNKNAR